MHLLFPSASSPKRFIFLLIRNVMIVWWGELTLESCLHYQPWPGLGLHFDSVNRLWRSLDLTYRPGNLGPLQPVA
jgi:hypothetical protein